MVAKRAVLAFFAVLAAASALRHPIHTAKRAGMTV
jgi:hypothetical protein